MSADETPRFCTFRLGHLTIGVDVRQVQEAIRNDQITKVPLAPAEVKGLINLRGQIITAVDLRTRFGLPDTGEVSTNVVIQVDDEVVSLLVDDVGDVLSPSWEDYETVPVAVPARVREVLSGAYKLDGGLLLVLDIHRALGRDALVGAT